MLKATREKWQISHRGTPIRYQLKFSKFLKPEAVASHLKWWKGRTCNQEYPASFPFRFEGKNKSFPRKAKVKRIQHHQSNFTTNTKGTSLGRKQKRRKIPTENLCGKIKNSQNIFKYDKLGRIPLQILRFFNNKATVINRVV